jgi:MFS transporter, FHS family, glucose/mannose:H+ symporter
VGFSRLAFACSLLAFMLIGAISAAYGPLLRSISVRFAVALPTAGSLLSIQFLGASAGVIAAWTMLRRFTGRVVMTVALLTLAMGCAAIASSRAWWFLAGAAALTGVGCGAIDFSLNQLMAATQARHRAVRLNILNAAFGAGAVAGPAVVTALRNAALTHGSLAAAVVACVLATSQRGISAPAQRVSRANILRTPGKPARRAWADQYGLLSLFACGYFCYVACESGTAGWIAAHLDGLGYSTRFAAAATSAFWLTLTIGRLAVVPLVHSVGARQVVLVASSLLACSLAFAAIPSLAPEAYAAAGLAAAPIFPTGLAWVAEVMPGDYRPASWAICASMVGGIAGPATVAALVSASSTSYVPAAVSVLGALTFVAFTYCARATRQAESHLS